MGENNLVEEPEEFLYGQQIRLYGEFDVASDPDDPESPKVAANPTATRLYIKKQDATVNTVLTYGVDGALIRDETGRFHYDWTPASDGLWHVRWEGTGNVQAPAEKSYLIVKSKALV